MKTKVKLVTKRSLSTLLAFLMIVSTVFVGTISSAMAVTYSTFYIVGDDMGWSFNSPGNKMTQSAGGYYYYYKVTGNGSDRLFRLKEGNSWDTNNVSFAYHTTANDHWSVNNIGHGTDNAYWMWDPSNSDGNMAYKANSGKIMYLLYYPDGTPLNSSGNGIVCAAKTLPDDTLAVKLGHYFDSTTSWGEVAMTNSSGTWSCSKNINTGLTREFAIEEVYGTHTTKYYKNTGTMTRSNCSGWAMDTNANSNCKITTDTTGSYSFSYNYSNKKLTVTYPAKTHTATASSATNGTLYVGTSSTVGTETSITVAEGTTYYIKATPNSGYKLTALKVGNTSVIGANANATSAVTVTRAMGTSDETVTATFALNTTPLSAPAITYNSSSATTQSMNAAKGEKARISWSSVDNAGSYEVYKGSSKVGTVTTTYYDIERGNSYGGAYTVKAVPSDTSSYSTSAASNSITFTFNKVALTAPSVTPNKTTILRNETVTFSISGGATSGTLGTDYKYQHSGANNTTYSDITGSSWTTGQLDNTTSSDVSDVFKFKTVAISTDYYSTSTGTTDKTITVKPAFGVDSGSTGTFTPGTATAMTYDSSTGYYSLGVTLTSTSNYYFRINQLGANPKWSTGWNTYPNVYDVELDGSKVTANSDVSGWDNKASMHYNGAAKKIIIWFDYANKKVWITGNSTKYNVTITQPTATGSSIKVNNATTSPQQFYDGDTVNYSVTAGTGNVITSVTVGGTTTNVDRKTSYSGSFEISAATAISATVVPQYSITANSATGGTYTVKRGNTSVTEFIAGDSLTLTPSPDTHYSFTNFTVTGGKSATLTANPSTLNTTGATGNITITPTWTAKSYSVSATAKYTNGAAAGSSYAASDFTQTFTTVPAVTIGSSSATNVTGVAVTAPATDPTGYKFVGWFTTKGTFTAPNDKNTTFKPNANSAVALAGYRKIHAINASVDSSGTGTGTVSISVTSGDINSATDKVLAGGAYKITATPAEGSLVESITVNNTNKGSEDSYTISGVSADQTVVVKFKSNVKLGNRYLDSGNTNTWNEYVMNAQSDGTYMYQFSNVPSGRNGQFKAKVGNTWKDYTSTTTFDDGATSCTLGSINDGGVNYKITTTEAVNIKVIFDPTADKITKVIVDPVSAVTYAITLGSPADAVLTATYRGTTYNEGDTINARAGQQITFSATTADNKYVSGYTLGGTAVTSPYTVTASDNGKTLTCTTADKFTVTAKTNKSARGTVSVNSSTVAPGATVTITVSPKNGVLKTLTYSYAGGKTYAWDTNRWKEVTSPTGSAKGFTKSKDIARTGAAYKSYLTGADSTYTFTVDANPTGNITINATFDPYSAESTWYYNGYDTSGAQLSGYHSKQMTEGMVGGEKFSYYHVEGRTGTDQLMTVSNGRVETGTRYVYFTQLKSGGWDYSHSPHAYFIGASNSWPGGEMTWYTDNDMNQPVYRIAIPAGATGVVFNDNGTHKSTDINDLSAGGYYVDEYSTWDGSNSVHTGHTYNCTYPSAGATATGTEYFYNSSIYTADFSTKGFNNHYVTSKGINFSKPKDLHPYTGDYYVNVLYPGKTYTINGVTKTVGNNNPLVIWTADPLMGDDEAVTVYAKDGSIRGSSKTYADIADTKIYASDGTTAKGTSVAATTDQTYETYKASKGETIVIKTTVVNAQKSKYYVRGFCVNGEVSELLSPNTSTGVYTLTYKIPEDIDSSKLEITPIYYLVDSDNKIVTFRVTGFTDTLKEVGNGKPNWGDTLYAYPFYGKLGGHNNAFGAYPGQPLVYYKGQYQIQIPKKSTAWAYDSNTYNNQGAANISAVNNTNVSGVTMSNGYYDVVHKSVMGYGDNSASADHVQTYDYGDFFKIFNEKAPVDNIVFDFKYKTKKHNLTDIITTNTTASALNTKYGTGGNGFELLTNFHGRHVDLFGTPLSGSAADPEQTTPVYVVSTGGVIDNTSGVENIAGYYATEWVVYGNTSGTTYQRISGGGKTSIPPEVLILNDDDNTSFNDTTYPSAVSGKNLTDWKALYTALEAYRGKPVMISYEAADAQQGQGKYYTGTGGATRNDGRWLYSKNGETITSKIRVDVSEDNGVTYTDNSTLNTPVSDLDAYFTNAEVEGETTYTTTIDPDKTFDMEAHSNNADYKFMGWYMDDGTKITTDNVTQTERSGSYTFVARFMHFTGGQLILGHKAVKGTAANSTNYNGSGNATIAVTVKNGDEIVREIAASSSDITLDDKIINNENSGYTIEVTLNASGTGEDTYARTECSAANTFFGGQSAYTTMPQTFTFTVGSLFSNNTQQTKKITYKSYFNQIVYSYKYTFNFTDRFGNAKSYVREKTLSAAQRESYVTGTGNESRVLTEAFVNSIAPHESNFNQTLKWNITASDRTFTKSGNNYTLTKSLTAVVDDSEGARSTKRTATFSLPYAHTNGVPSNINIMDKATSTNFVISEIEYGTLVKTGSGEDDYVVAPRQLNDEGTVKNFQYWSMASTKNPKVEVARCYFYSFNFVAFDSYIITPIYDTAVSPLNSGTGSNAITTVSFLETSRNQFNGTGASSNDLSTAADILYNDFVLSYNYNGLDIYKNDSSSSAVTNIGYVVERVQKLEVQQDGTPYTDPSHYDGVEVKTEEVIKKFISGTATTEEQKNLTKYELAKNNLDNKNRVQFYEAYYNSKNWDKDSQKFTGKSVYKNYVYKAYSYMIVNGVITLSDPAYFTMYEEAAK